jgi:hypothetical protein
MTDRYHAIGGVTMVPVSGPAAFTSMIGLGPDGAPLPMLISAALMVLIIPAVHYISTFGDMFPLIEYRQWIDSSFSSEELPVFLKNMFASNDPFSRWFPIFAVRVAAAACGYSIPCGNIFLIGLLLASGLMVFTLSMQITGRRYALPAAVLSLGFMFTEPVVYASTWQGTSLDKFAVFMTLATLNVLVAVLNRPFTPSTAMVSNLSLLPLTWLAYNSKEAAWGLVPVMVAMTFLAFMKDGADPLRTRIVEACRRMILMIGVPVGFACYHVARMVYLQWLALNENPGSLDRVISGNLADNLLTFFRYMLNLAAPAPTGILLLVVSLIVVITVLLRLPSNTQHAGFYKAVLSATCVGFTISIAIPAPTVYASAFYLLVPVAYFYLLLFLIIALALDRVGNAAVRLATAVALIALLGTHMINFRTTSVPYEQMAMRSRNFVEVIDAAGHAIPTDNNQPVDIYYLKSTFVSYMFFDPEYERALHRYICPACDPKTKAWDHLIRTIGVDAEDQIQPNLNATNIILGSELKLVSITPPVHR